MNDFDPDWTIHPRWVVWEYIISELDLLEEESDALEKVIMECGEIDKKTAGILDELFGRPAKFWMALQKDYDYGKAHGKKVLQ